MPRRKKPVPIAQRLYALERLVSTTLVELGGRVANLERYALLGRDIDLQGIREQIDSRRARMGEPFDDDAAKIPALPPLPPKKHARAAGRPRRAR